MKITIIVLLCLSLSIQESVKQKLSKSHNKFTNRKHKHHQVISPVIKVPSDISSEHQIIDPQPNTIGSQPFRSSASITTMRNQGGHSKIEQSVYLHNPSRTDSLNNKYDYPLRVSNQGQSQSCPCASQMKCGCGDSGVIMTGECGCAAKPQCPPCILAKTMRQMHQLASENALQDAEEQRSLEEQSALESRLFQEAKRYAQIAMGEENEARLASIQVQQHSSNAQIARNKMNRAETQAKQLALEAVKSMSVHPPHESQGVPGMSIHQVGVATKTIVDQTPYYNLHVGATDSTGFNDIIGQEINTNTNRSRFKAQDEKPLDDLDDLNI